MNDDHHDPVLRPVLDLARPVPSDIVLDCACGAGQLAFSLAPLVETVEAVDDDPEVLKEAERLATELRVAGVVFRHADVHELPYPAGRFTLVVAQGLLHRLADPAAVVREMTRVLAAGGRIVLEEPTVDKTTDRHFNELARLREPGHWRHHRADEYEELFRKCDLRVTEGRRVRRTVDLDYWIEVAQTPPGTPSWCASGCACCRYRCRRPWTWSSPTGACRSPTTRWWRGWNAETRAVGSGPSAYPRKPAISSMSLGFGKAPTTRLQTCPASNARMVGMLITSYCWAMAGSSSTFSFTNLMLG